MFVSTAPFSPSQDAVCVESVVSVNARANKLLPGRPDPSRAKIYIAREDGQNIDGRATADQSIVKSGILERLGFRPVVLSRLPLDLQMEIFASASHIAGVHGAGLMNIAFAHDGLKVTEFVVSNAANYYTIAMFSSSLGFDYRAIDMLECVTEDGPTLSADGARIIEEALMR